MDDSISRQAVDKIIDDLLENDNLQASPSVWHGLHMIKQLPSAQSEDFNEWCFDCKEYDQNKHCCPRYNRVIREALNAVEAQWKKGKWIKDEELSANYTEPIFFCSSCHNYEAWGWTECTNYCPNCGAKMDLKETQ